MKPTCLQARIFCVPRVLSTLPSLALLLPIGAGTRSQLQPMLIHLILRKRRDRTIPYTSQARSRLKVKSFLLWSGSRLRQSLPTLAHFFASRDQRVPGTYAFISNDSLRSLQHILNGTRSHTLILRS